MSKLRLEVLRDYIWGAVFVVLFLHLCYLFETGRVLGWPAEDVEYAANR